MLRKVTGAKDRFKQRMHHGQHPMPSKPRSHKHRAVMTAVSLSAVDNAAFESILDDDTDFMSKLNLSPSALSSTSGCNSSPMTHLPTSNPQESDIFNTDTFYVDQPEEERRKDVEKEDGVQGLVNCDPLSGQIVSQRVKEEESRNGNDSRSEIEDCRNGNEEENVIEEKNRNVNEEESCSCSGEVGNDGVEIHSSEPFNCYVQNGARDDANGADSNISLSESSSDNLFDNETHTSKPILIPVGPTDQSSTLQNSDHHQRESSYHSELGLSGALSDASPPSSFPSSLENELDISLSSPSDSATLQAEEHESTLTTPHQCSPPPCFPADFDRSPIVKRYHTVNPIPPTPSHAKEDTHSQDESPSTGIESELEQLLASPKTLTSGFVLPKSPNEGSSKTMNRSSSEGEGSGAHLDSGVFEHYGTERDSTPELERDKGRNARQAESIERKAFIVEEGHFSTTQCSSMETAALCRPENTHCSQTTSISQFNHPFTNIPSVSSAVNPPCSSRSKGPPPPRPPLPLQGLKKTAVQHSSAAADQVRGQYVHPLGRTKPCNRSMVVLDQKTELEDRIVSDVLFSEDEKLEVRTSTIFSSEVEVGKEVLSQADEVELSHVKSTGGTTGQVMGASPSDGDHHHSTPVSKTSITSTLAVSDAEASGPCITLLNHSTLSAILYLYYSLNIFPYLAGLFAGFFTLFLFLGSLFVCYMLSIDEKQKEKRQQQKTVKLSDDFVRTMKVDFSKLKVYQSNRFTATLTYDLSTHHPSHRMRTELKLREDFKLFIQVIDENYVSFLISMVDIRKCQVSIEPTEVAQNRKRRWSKKFPIVINCPSGPRKFKVYLFSPTSREKEYCFRRLRSAANGFTTKQLIHKQKEFFAYMQKYFSDKMLTDVFIQPTAGHHEASTSSRKHFGHGGRHSTNHRSSTLVEFSKSADTDEFSDSSEPSGGVNIKRTKGVPRSYPSSLENAHLTRHSPIPTTSPLAMPSARSSSPSSSPSQASNPSMQKEPHLTKLPTSTTVENDEYEVVDDAPDQHNATINKKSMSSLPHPMRSTPEDSPNLWLNAMAARLCWDVWHEKRWKDWIMARIQKKLIRVKTPSFMEQLQLTNIDIGNDMPLLNRLIGGPRLDLKGIWIYLDVTYQGKFVMTIETKMKLGGKGVASSNESNEKGQQMTSMTSKTEDESSLSMGSSLHTMSDMSKLSHTQAARSLGGGEGSCIDPEDDIDSGSDEEDRYLPHPLMEEALTATHNLTTPSPASTSVPAPPAGLIKSMVTRMAKKMVSTRIVQRAAEKVSSYPLVLTVELKRLDGVLAVNIPPPSTDTIWWGFHSSPKLELVAKPKLGMREVKLSKVTHWIEKKLCDLVNKKLVLPEMEDLVIPILNSGMPEDTQNPISSDSDPSSNTNSTSPS